MKENDAANIREAIHNTILFAIGVLLAAIVYRIVFWPVNTVILQLLEIWEPLSFWEGSMGRDFELFHLILSAVLILFTSVHYWNMWFEPMIYLTKRSMYPIQSVLREILIDNNTTMASAGANRNAQAKLLRESVDQAAVYHLIKYANIIVTTVPILCVYPFAQKYFVKGVMIGSLKG